MTEEQWILEARKLIVEVPADPSAGYTWVRDALIVADRLMRTAPRSIIEHFLDIKERDLAAHGNSARNKLAEGKPVDTEGGLSPAEVTFRLASKVRGLDTLLVDQAAHLGPSFEPNEEWFSDAEQAFVVPRARRRKAPTEPGTQTYQRRGLLNHRIFPASVSGCAVTLHALNDPIGADEADRRLGAALFPSFSLETRSPAEGTFLADRINCVDQDQIIRAHVQRAIEDNCYAVAWPELTMPEAQLSRLIDALTDLAGSHPKPLALEWLLGGSWHVEGENCAYRNVAPILDRYGTIVFRYEKSVAYRDPKLGREAIKAGSMLPILLTDTHAIAFGICKDFCALGDESPYAELAVDLVAVGSMGNAETMEGHKNVAKTVRVRMGASVFVVQQAEPEVADYAGYVLPPLKNPSRPTVGELLAGEWSTAEWKVEK